MLGLDPDEPAEPAPKYGWPQRGMGWTVLGALAGVGGYIGLFLVDVYWTPLLNMTASGWLTPVIATVPPLMVMVAAAYLLKSRAMLVSSFITFGAFFLACGTCYALLSGLH